ncbi:MAG: HlyC/CorC family transporter [Clostridia bacterium]|nr:HlyC/CorC family transporter [Clostridia bacterium]
MLLQVILIFINAFFAAAEIAVISLNENKLRKAAEEGDAKAQTMLRMVLSPSGFLSTIQVAITLAGFLGSAFAADNFSDLLVDWLIDGVGFTALPRATLNTVAVVLITLLLSFFTLVFGELVPKRIAMKFPDQVARFVCGPVNVMSKVFRPIIFVLSHTVNGVLRLFGIDPKADEENVTEDEIRLMVDIGEEKGTIEGDEHDMIENVFEFNNMTAADCMTHRTDVTALQIDDSNARVLRTIRESGLSRFPVYGENLDDVKGTVTTRDILLNLVSGNARKLRDIVRPAYFVPETVRTDVLFREMQKRKTHLAIVVDEYGGTAGLITMEDLLEQIVGNIDDEYDPQRPQDIQPVGDGVWRVAGSSWLEDVSEALGVPIPPSEEYDTLGGLVFSRLATIPKDGTHPSVTAYGLKIDVEEIKDRRVIWARVNVPRQGPEMEAKSREN